MKIYRISGKTWRDRKDTVTLYHASPNRLSQISAMSSFGGSAGAFFSPTYKSIARDWAPWVANKKNSAHPLKKQWKDIWNRIRELEDLSTRNQQEEDELRFLHKKIDRLSDSFENMDKQQQGYSKVFVHKIACPREIFDKYQERIRRKQEEEEMHPGNYGFWMWGEQIFIDEKDLPALKVIKSEEWKKPKVFDEERNAWLNRYRSNTGWQESEMSDPNTPVPKYDPEKTSD